MECRSTNKFITTVICALGFAFAEPAIAGESLADAGQQGKVETLIAEYFPDNYSTMRAVAVCESGLVHRVNGSLKKNPRSSAKGVLQILMSVHGPEMKRLGLNPNDDEDYMTYARRLYESQGLAPWAESKKCWKNKKARKDTKEKLMS